MFRNKTKFLVLSLVAAMLGFLVASTAAIADSENGIVTPSYGALLQGSVVVSAIADDPNFAAWQLDLLPVNDPNTADFVSRGTNRAAIPSRLDRIDSANYPNGDYQLRLRVIRTDGNYTEYFTDVGIDNGPLSPNGITDPMENTVLGCLATIQGIAHASSFNKWQLDVLVGGSENNIIPVDHGSQPRASEGILGQLDTTQLPNGTHLLRLRIVHEDGNYDTYYSRIRVDNKVMAEALSRKTCNCSAYDPTAPSTADAAMPNGVSNPPSGSTTRGTIPVCGKANDPNIAEWEMDLMFNGDESQSVIVAHGGSGTGARALLTMLDTTQLPDGKYGLRLRVARADDTVDDTRIYFCIANQKALPAGANCSAPAVGTPSTP